MGRKPELERREELLEAITTHVLEHGLTDLSFRPLARTLGISTYKLVYHFGSKEGLVTAVLGAAEEWQGRRIWQYVEAGEAWSFRTLLVRQWQWLTTPEAQAYHRLFFEVHGVALQQPDRYPEYSSRPFLQGLELLQELCERRGLDPTEAQTVATLVLATLWGLLLDLLTTGDVARTTAALEAYAETVDATTSTREEEQRESRRVR